MYACCDVLVVWLRPYYETKKKRNANYKYIIAIVVIIITGTVTPTQTISNGSKKTWQPKEFANLLWSLTPGS